MSCYIGILFPLMCTQLWTDLHTGLLIYVYLCSYIQKLTSAHGKMFIFLSVSLLHSAYVPTQRARERERESERNTKRETERERERHRESEISRKKSRERERHCDSLIDSNRQADRQTNCQAARPNTRSHTETDRTVLPWLECPHAQMRSARRQGSVHMRTTRRTCNDLCADAWWSPYSMLNNTTANSPTNSNADASAVLRYSKKGWKQL